MALRLLDKVSQKDMGEDNAMSTNGGTGMQLSCRINYRGTPCSECGKMAIITQEWYSNLVLGPLAITQLNARGSPGEEQVVGKEMFTLCLYCLRRERYIVDWDSATKLPSWKRIEEYPGTTEDVPA